MSKMSMYYCLFILCAFVNGCYAFNHDPNKQDPHTITLSSKEHLPAAKSISKIMDTISPIKMPYHATQIKERYIPSLEESTVTVRIWREDLATEAPVSKTTPGVLNSGATTGANNQINRRLNTDNKVENNLVGLEEPSRRAAPKSKNPTMGVTNPNVTSTGGVKANGGFTTRMGPSKNTTVAPSRKNTPVVSGNTTATTINHLGKGRPLGSSKNPSIYVTLGLRTTPKSEPPVQDSDTTVNLSKERSLEDSSVELHSYKYATAGLSSKEISTDEPPQDSKNTSSKLIKTPNIVNTFNTFSGGLNGQPHGNKKSEVDPQSEIVDAESIELSSEDDLMLDEDYYPMIENTDTTISDLSSKQPHSNKISEILHKESEEAAMLDEDYYYVIDAESFPESLAADILETTTRKAKKHNKNRHPTKSPSRSEDDYEHKSSKTYSNYAGSLDTVTKPKKKGSKKIKKNRPYKSPSLREDDLEYNPKKKYSFSKGLDGGRWKNVTKKQISKHTVQHRCPSKKNFSPAIQRMKKRTRKFMDAIKQLTKQEHEVTSLPGYNKSWSLYVGGDGLVYQSMIQRKARFYRPLETCSVDFYLYTRDNPYDELYLDIEDKTCFNYQTVVDSKLIIVVLPRQGHVHSSYCQHLKNAYLNYDNHIVVCMDWSRVFDINYLDLDCAPHLVRSLGEKLAEAINFFASTGYCRHQMHLIGIGLGAHIAGMAGEIFQGDIARITGISPSSDILQAPSNMILQKHHAKFVDVIHTECHLFGIYDPMGHVDIYPNGGGKMDQPGCTHAPVLSDVCNYNRAFEYFVEAVNDPNNFLAIECSSYNRFVMGLCACKEIIPMSDIPSTAHGLYFLNTNSRPNYGRGHPIRDMSILNIFKHT